MAKTRNSEILKSFVSYCEAHPDERFWQALRNWSGYSYVIAVHVESVDTGFVELQAGRNIDTFFLEKRRHDEKDLTIQGERVTVVNEIKQLKDNSSSE